MAEKGLFQTSDLVPLLAERGIHLSREQVYRLVTVVGVEVKAAETVRAEDFRGLRHLAKRPGDRFRAGIVLSPCEQQLSFGDRLNAVPMAALWTLDSSAS